MVLGLAVVGAAVDFLGPVELGVPFVVLGVAQAEAPAGEVIPCVVFFRFSTAPVDEGSCFEAGHIRLDAHFAGHQIAVITVAVAGAVGADTVHAAEEELFAAVEGVVSQLEAGIDAVVEFIVVPYFEQITGQFIVVAVVIGCHVLRIQTAVPINQIVLGELIRIVLTAADADVEYVGRLVRPVAAGNRLEAQLIFDIAVVVAVDGGDAVHAVAVDGRHAVDADAAALAQGVEKAAAVIQLVARLAVSYAEARAAAADGRFVAQAVALHIMAAHHAADDEFIALVAGIVDLGVEAVAVAAGVVAAAVVDEYVVIPDGAALCLDIYLGAAGHGAGAEHCPRFYAGQVI